MDAVVDNPLLWMMALPLLGAPLAYLAGSAWTRFRSGDGAPARLVALLCLLGAWIPFGSCLRYLVANGPLAVQIGDIGLRLDGVSLLLAAVALGLGTLVALYSGAALDGEDGQAKYYAMLLAMIGAMIGLGSAADLFNLWLWFEAMTISSYLLVAFHREQRASLEAGVKYLVQSAAGSVLVLLGVALVLAQTGTMDLSEIRQAGSPSAALLVSGGLFVVGFGVKAALVPLHTWLPDAHAQAPSGISAMLSGVVIEAALVGLLRVLAALAGFGQTWGVLLMAVGAINVLVGNLLALGQVRVKRLLAYSSISHMGFILLGIAFGLYARQQSGAQGGLFHLINHGLMKGLAFLAAGALIYALGLQLPGRHRPLTIPDLDGTSRRYPTLALAFSLAVLGLAGLPPLAGFMSKWQIIAAGVASRDWWLIGLALFAGINSLISLGYYFPLVNAVYRSVPSEAVQNGRALPVTMQIPILVLGLAVVALGLWPRLVGPLVEPAGAALLAMFP